MQINISPCCCVLIWWIKCNIHLFQFDVLQQISFSITNNRTTFRTTFIWPQQNCYEYIFLFQHTVKLTSVKSVTNLKFISSVSFQIWPKFKSVAISRIFLSDSLKISYFSYIRYKGLRCHAVFVVVCKKQRLTLEQDDITNGQNFLNWVLLIHIFVAFATIFTHSPEPCVNKYCG